MCRRISSFRSGLGLFAAAVLAALSLGAPAVLAQDAVVMTDKPDYAPGEIAIITGAGFEPGETVTLEVDHTDDTTPGGAGHEPWDVTADGAGGFTTSWYVDPDDSAWSSFILTATGQTSGLVAQTTFTDMKIDAYDQCSNDVGTGYTTGDTGCRWINGDINDQNSRYFEGDATIQRVWLDELPAGTTHTLRLKYGTTKGGKHAYDFLTTWDWSEGWASLADRCQGVTGCTTAGETTWDIPPDANVPDSFEPSTPGDRMFTMRGGTLTAATAPTIDSGSYGGDSETVITITFDVAGSGPMCTSKGCGIVLWFGGHVAAQNDWGLGQGAGSISGSPYHVALDAFDNAAIGQRDNQMKADTVVANGTIVIVKNAVPNDAHDFTFNLNNNNTINQGFSLDDDAEGTLSSTQTFSVPPGAWSASELNIPEPWSLTSLACSDPTNNTTVNGATATIDLASSETVTCTFTDTKDLCAGVVCSDTACSNFECDPADGQCKVASFSPTGTACGDASAGECDSADTCNGTGSCQDNNASAGTTCGDAGTECTNQDLCDGDGACSDSGYQSAGTACGDSSAGECDNADSCNGAGSCQSNHASAGTTCGDAGTECTNQDLCDGDGACADSGYQNVGTACGDSSAGECDSADTCSGTGSCQDNNASAGTTCGDAGTECTNQDLCDGDGACADSGYQNAGTACGDSSAGECDNADSCSGTGSCQDNNASAGTTCGDAGTECTNQDLCDGDGACSDSGYQSAGTACGDSSAGECDSADTCSGTGSCQSNHASAGTTCGDAGTECTNQDLCDGDGACSDNGYQSAGTACGDSSDTVCDNPDSCDGGGGCQINNEPATTECRAVAGVCDVAELCDGAGSCPGDAFKPVTVLCNAGSGDPNASGFTCDPDEYCTGTSADCPADVVATQGTVCNLGGGDPNNSGFVCDPDEVCSGLAGDACPADTYASAITVCNAGGGDPNGSGFVCDPDEFCGGVADAACPGDTFASASTVCNAGSGDPNNSGYTCDPNEVCSGFADTACPADTFVSSGTVCNAGGGDPNGSGFVCDPDEVCSGVADAPCAADSFASDGTICNAGSGDPNGSGYICDPNEACSGVADSACPADTIAANGTVCNAGSGDPNGSGFVCDPDEVCSGVAGAPCSSDTYASASTVCNAGSGDFCDPDDECPGTADGACPADTIEPAGTQCRADSGLCDVAEQCTGVADETCPANAREECGVVTSSSICTFNVTDTCSGPGREFKLIYTPESKAWPAYKLNGSNPGQYYYNLFVEGDTSVTVQIPWPFVTQGAMPVHVYDAAAVNTTGTCILYPPGGQAFDLTITVADRLNGKAAAGSNGGFVDCPGPLSGLPGAPAPPDDVCTIQVPLPSTGGYFVAIHLDYGFKGLNVDANPKDNFADRYDKAASLGALVNTADNTGALAIPQCYAHNFCHAAGSGGESGCDITDVVRNANEFKKIAGVFGRLTDTVGGPVSGHVNLYRPSTGQIVGQADTDTDGYYTIPYKHTGSQESYQVQMTSTDPSYPGGLNVNVVLKANGFAEANFKWNGLAWIQVP